MSKGEKFAFIMVGLAVFGFIFALVNHPEEWTMHEADIKVDGQNCVVVERKTEGWFNKDKRQWFEVYCGREKGIEYHG
jgi:hypothetical protein